MEKNLYPFTWKGKKWTVKNVDSTFKVYYTCKEALDINMSVYAYDGIRVQPDGTAIEQ